MNFEILGWVGFAITIIAFGTWNHKKLGGYFPHMNFLAAIFLVIYEFSIAAWSLFALHSFIGITSFIKVVKNRNKMSGNKFLIIRHGGNVK